MPEGFINWEALPEGALPRNRDWWDEDLAGFDGLTDEQDAQELKRVEAAYARNDSDPYSSR